MSLEAFDDEPMPGKIRDIKPMRTGVAELPGGRRVGWFATPDDIRKIDDKTYIVGTLLSMDGTKVLVDPETGKTTLLPRT
ncbi:MAG: hypothetical protein AAB606_03120 [Patescibacteria group bacterium]